jgi:putative ABC transport system permease protein
MLGIGATTAIFSVVYGVLLRPLPYPDAESLVLIGAESTFGGRRQPANFSGWELDEWRARTHHFQEIAGYATGDVALDTEQGVEPLNAECVSSNFFRLAGEPMALGRPLGPGDERSATAVISTRLWHRRFGSDAGIVGRSLVLNGESFTIAGVAPPDFRLPEPGTELWVPLEYAKTNGIAPWLNSPRGGGLLMIGRLAAGTTLAEARSDLQAAHRGLVQDGLERRDARDITLTTTVDAVAGSVRPALVVLLIAVALAFLVACANVMQLLLAWQSSRARELALRVALGASGARLIGETLAEAGLLGGAGGIAGILLADGIVRVLVWLHPVALPRLDAIRVDVPVLAFAAATSLLAVFAAGLFPAVRAVRENATAVLTAGTRQVGDGRRGRRVRRSLAVSELALSIILLVSAGLLARSFIRLVHADVGARTDHTEAALLDLSIGRSLSPDAERALAKNLVARVRALPGVQDAALGAALPPAGERARFTLRDLSTPRGLLKEYQVNAIPVTPDFFHALGVPLLRGRTFSTTDDEGARPVMIVDADTAALLFGENALGRELSLPTRSRGNTSYTLVGIVGNVRYKGLARPPGGAIYLPFQQAPWSSAYLLARTEGDPTAIASDLRRVIGDVDRHIGVLDVRSLDEIISQQLAQPQFRTVMLSSIALLALLLAASGIYGLIAYSVSQRTAEFGVRLALGATGRDIAWLVLRDAAQLGIAGCVLGLSGAYALTSTLTGFLYGIDRTDPLSYGLAALFVLLVVGIATFLPALRAVKVDPMISLRAS